MAAGDLIVPLWRVFWSEAYPLRNKCSLGELERVQITAHMWAHAIDVAVAERRAQRDKRRERREARRASA